MTTALLTPATIEDLASGQPERLSNPPATRGDYRAEGSQSFRKLEALTSLRFFAAIMILALHLSQMFKFYDSSILKGVALFQGVSIFFVLSGFILAFVHTDLKDSDQADNFMLARFARIWPTHLATFVLTCILVPPVLSISNFWLVAAANLAMIQTWFFVPWVSTSFNNVSWTLSIELFFYFCFPFLIRDFYKPYKFRWLAAALLSLACIGFYVLMFKPAFNAGQHLSSSMYIGENPFVRLGEFTLGIATCWLYKETGLTRRLSRRFATVIELSVLVLIIAAMNVGNIFQAPLRPGALFAIRSLSLTLACTPFAAILIFLLASERGLISKALKHPVFVHLGEISFALYMVHMPILNYATLFQSRFANQPGFLLPTIVVLVCLVAAELCFRLVEVPCRKLILCNKVVCKI